jgi:hypothetical protein
MPEVWPPSASATCSRLIDERGGPVTPGGRCEAHGDCASSPGSLSLCAISIDDRLGHCQRLLPGKEGDSCLATLDEVGVDPVIASGFEGIFCSHLAGLVCEPLDRSTKGHSCQRLLATDSPCTVNYECASNKCAGDGSDHRCAAAPTPDDLPDGSSCAENLNCASEHCLKGVCQPAAQVSAFQMLCAQ